VEVLSGAQGLAESPGDVAWNGVVDVDSTLTELDVESHQLLVVQNRGDMARFRDVDRFQHRYSIIPAMLPRPMRMKHKILNDYLYTRAGGPITVDALARIIKTPIERMQLLIEHKYLRVIMKKADFSQTVLACPREDAINWLRNMSQPLELRPYIPLEDVHRLVRGFQGRILEDAPKKLRQVCYGYNIPIIVDPVYGELLTIEGLAELAYRLRIYRYPTRHDRATMLEFLCSALPPNVIKQHPLRLPDYTHRLSARIRQIAQLENPERTFQAIALYNAWRDVRSVHACLRRLDDPRDLDRKYKGIPLSIIEAEVEQLDKDMEKMKDSVS
jgi:hypothetical protein